MDRSEYNQFLAAMEMGEHTGSLQDIIKLTENLDCYDVYPDIEDYDALDRYYIEELGAMQIPSYLENYIDYETYGRDVAMEEGCEFTEFGYVSDIGDTFYEVYDGDRENISVEYRVMNFRDEDVELSENEKLDMATDLAFDLDEFSGSMILTMRHNARRPTNRRELLPTFSWRARLPHSGSSWRKWRRQRMMFSPAGSSSMSVRPAMTPNRFLY
jgi:hypothetical protein